MGVMSRMVHADCTMMSPNQRLRLTWAKVEVHHQYAVNKQHVKINHFPLQYEEIIWVYWIRQDWYQQNRPKLHAVPE